MRVINTDYIINAITALARHNINSLRITPNYISGVDEDRRVVMFIKGALPFGYMATNNVVGLAKRLTVLKPFSGIAVDMDVTVSDIKNVVLLASKAKAFGIDVDIDESMAVNDACDLLKSAVNEKIGSGINKPKSDEYDELFDSLKYIVRDVEGLYEYARTITFSANSISITEKCSSPYVVETPRVINDEIIYSISIEKSYSMALKKIVGNNETITLAADEDNGVYYHANYGKGWENDIHIQLGDCADGVKFNHKYPSAMLSKLAERNAEIEIGGKGILKYTYDGYDFFWLPKV